MEIEIGRGKKARRAYGFDDIAIVPSRGRATRRTSTSLGGWGRISWSFRSGLGDGRRGVTPDGHVLGRLGGLGVLNLEGIWTRYEDADAQLERIATFEKGDATHAMQEIYAEPVKPELVARRGARSRPRASSRPLRSRRSACASTTRRRSTRGLTCS